MKPPEPETAPLVTVILSFLKGTPTVAVVVVQRPPTKSDGPPPGFDDVSVPERSLQLAAAL